MRESVDGERFAIIDVRRNIDTEPVESQPPPEHRGTLRPALRPGTFRVESAPGQTGSSEHAMSIRDRRIVVVNDDGIDAHGLSILERAARQCCDDVWVVAPAENQSGRGRALSWRQNVEVEARGERRFAVHGTPADCVLVALNGLLGRQGADLVLSGVNAGSNLANDIGSSGTVGACFEAAELGVPAIAFSQRHAGRGERNAWACAERLTAHLLPRLFDAMGPPRRVLNVNFPALARGEAAAGLEVTHSGWREGPTSIEERLSAGGRRVFHIYTIREDQPNAPDCDLDLVQRGYVTVTPLGLDQTRHEDLAGMQERLRDALPLEAAAD